MPRKKKSNKGIYPYRSKFEKLIGGKLKGCEHEPIKLPYVSEHVYIPDFIPKKNPNLLIEVKGRFRTRAEAAKYIHIRESNPDYEIVFVFMAPKTPMPGAQRRKKCGTKQSVSEWAETNGFKWYDSLNLPKEWL